MKPKIFCFSNMVGGSEGIAYALAEDGIVLGSHFCSHESYVPGDLGVIEGARPDRHEHYAKHYPDGYEMEFIPARQVKEHDMNAELPRNRLPSQKVLENKEGTETVLCESVVTGKWLESFPGWYSNLPLLTKIASQRN